MRAWPPGARSGTIGSHSTRMLWSACERRKRTFATACPSRRSRTRKSRPEGGSALTQDARASTIVGPLQGFLRSPRLYIGLQRMLGAERVRQISLERFAKLREGERVLDIGCGPGQVL